MGLIPQKPQSNPPTQLQHTLHPVLLSVCHPRHWPDQFRDRKNKATLLPKPLNFQALWFPCRPFVKDCRLTLPLLFQSAGRPTKRETSSPSQLKLGKEFRCLGLWAGGPGASAVNSMPPLQPGWPQPGPLQFLPRLLGLEKGKRGSPWRPSPRKAM